jgi:hypothetical protein
LVTLDSLLRASPVINRFFDGYAVEITEAILSSGFICGHIRVIIRVIALIRSSTLPIQNFREFELRVIRDALRYRSRVRRSREGFAPEHLAGDTKPAVIRSILATARQLTCISLDCLEFYLVRFRALRPDRLVDPKFKFNATTAPESCKFDVQDVGPPSWTEEQRVTRAFWRLQLLYDLKKAATNSLLNWPENDIKAMNDLQPMDLYGPQMHLEQGVERRTPPEYEEINSVTDYMREVQGCQDPTQLWLARASGPREVQRDWAIPAPEGKDWRKLVDPSPGYRFHRYASSDSWNNYSPLFLTKFDSFRSLGFAFWSWERMCAYGLPVPATPVRQYRHQYCYYAWQSILSPDEIAEAERKRKGVPRPYSHNC